MTDKTESLMVVALTIPTGPAPLPGWQCKIALVKYGEPSVNIVSVLGVRLAYTADDAVTAELLLVHGPDDKPVVHLQGDRWTKDEAQAFGSGDHKWVAVTVASIEASVRTP